MRVSPTLRVGIAFIISPWAAALIVAMALAIGLNLSFDKSIFGFYSLWLGIGGQVLSLLVCAPAYAIARSLTALTFTKVVLGSGLLVGGGVGVLSLLAASTGMQLSEGFGEGLILGAGAFAMMGALGGAIFWLISGYCEKPVSS